MQVVVSPDQLQVPPGTIMRLLGSWQDYQTLAQRRGDSSIPRLKYRCGEILLMSPLPVHGRDANIIADIVKALLDRLDQDYEAFTPVTLGYRKKAGLNRIIVFILILGKWRLASNGSTGKWIRRRIW